MVLVGGRLSSNGLISTFLVNMIFSLKSDFKLRTKAYLFIFILGWPHGTKYRTSIPSGLHVFFFYHTGWSHSTKYRTSLPGGLHIIFSITQAGLIAQSIGQAFQVAYMEFLKANGIEDTSMMKEMDYQEVLNQQEIFGEELYMFSNKEMQKDVSSLQQMTLVREKSLRAPYQLIHHLKVWHAFKMKIGSGELGCSMS